MRIYTESSEETLRARKLLTQSTGDGSLSKEQYQRLEQETVSGLRITNIFLRLVLFFFTMIGVAAAVALGGRLANPDDLHDFQFLVGESLARRSHTKKLVLLNRDVKRKIIFLS